MAKTKNANYSCTQRALHWGIALLVFILLPTGFWMTTRGEAGIWDGLTGTLYATHKSIGFAVLWLMFWRAALKLLGGKPPYPAHMPDGQKQLACVTQRGLYLLMFVVPLLGWAGVTAFPALNIFAGLHLPAMPLIEQSQDLAKQILGIHGWLAIALCVLIAMHIAGALKHKWIDRDGVFERMSSGKNTAPANK